MSRDMTPSHGCKTYGSSRAVRLPDFNYAGDVDIHVVVCARSGKPSSNPALAAEVSSHTEEHQCCQVGELGNHT